MDIKTSLKIHKIQWYGIVGLIALYFDPEQWHVKDCRSKKEENRGRHWFLIFFSSRASRTANGMSLKKPQLCSSASVDRINQYSFARYNGALFVFIVYFIFTNEWNNFSLPRDLFKAVLLKLAYCNKNLHLFKESEWSIISKYELNL